MIPHGHAKQETRRYELLGGRYVWLARAALARRVIMGHDYRCRPVNNWTGKYFTGVREGHIK